MMGATIDPLVQFKNVFESYDGRSVLKDVSFSLREGELVALIGAQDAGKTTILRLLFGLAQADGGDISLFGLEPMEINARRELGAVLADTGFPPNLKLSEVIELVRAHYPEPTSVQELVQKFGFEGRLDQSTSDLSSGDKRWLSILLAFAGNPRAVFMDMPTMGMDVGWRRVFWNVMHEFVESGGLALMTTNELHEVQTFATRVLIMHKGELVADGTVGEIIDGHGGRTMHMRVDELPDLDDIDGVDWHDDGPTVHATDPDSVVRQLAKRDVPFTGLEVRRPELEEVLLALIQESE